MQQAINSHRLVASRSHKIIIPLHQVQASEIFITPSLIHQIYSYINCTIGGKSAYDIFRQGGSSGTLSG